MSKPESEPRNNKPTHEDVLRQLITEQGVRPINDLDQPAALWPADDDPEALMNFVLTERRARVRPN